MKKILLFALISGLFFSCKKDKAEETSFYFSAKIDGVERTFNVNMFGVKQTEGDNYAYIFGGTDEASSSPESFGIVITNLPGNQQITARTYTDAETDFEILTTYGDGTNDFEAGTSVYNEGNSGDIANHYQVNVQTLTTEVISGTFSGSFYMNGDLSSTKKEMTDGKFRVKLTQP